MLPINRKDILTALGLPAKLPPEGLKERWHVITSTSPGRYFGGDVLVRVLPQAPMADRSEALPFRTKVRRPHRVEVSCRCCGKWIPAGRVAQHAVVHKV